LETIIPGIYEPKAVNSDCVYASARRRPNVISEISNERESGGKMADRSRCKASLDSAFVKETKTSESLRRKSNGLRNGIGIHGIGTFSIA
jgi:hypothetical protein